MISGGEGKKWTCRKPALVSLQKVVASLLRDLSQPCLSQSGIQVVLTIGKMLKPQKWQAFFDCDGKVSGFHKALKLIILGGIDPSIRAQVWEFLLGCYALGSTSEYRRQLRVARRERYNELLKQCQMMHSSVGTGSLAYVVGSKVMDMRKSYKNEAVKEAIDEGREACLDGNENTEDHRDWSNNDTNKSHVHRRGSSSESVDLVSPDSTVYETSPFVPASSPYGFPSPGPFADDIFDFPSLPVTDLFGRSSLGKKGISTPDEETSTHSDLRSEDEGMHSFRIYKNADLVIEPHGSSNSNVTVHHESVEKLSHSGCTSEIVDGLRISDVPETPSASETPTRGGSVKKDRVSEWLWTLHRIVVDVVRTDSHLEFYEDPGNLGRMSDILAVYAWVDPATGYCQGMSDLVSPFVFLFEDNADAFWCFEMLIRRTRANFQMEGPTGVMDQLQSLWRILQLTDKEMFSHLSRIGAESLHFAFRMLLVLFRRELSFNEALRMWEMMWAADFDESFAETLEKDCLKPLVVQLPKRSGVDMGDHKIDDGNGTTTNCEPTSKCDRTSKSSLLSKSGLLPESGPLPKTGPLSDGTGMKPAVSSCGKGDDPLPVFCVAAILIMNRHKIMKETHSIDDMIKIFNDKLLAIRVRRCIRTAIKLRKKYLYKNQVIKIESHTLSQNHKQHQIQNQTAMENQILEEFQSHDENCSQRPSLCNSHVP
ncbi:RabGAP/TBC domain-containing protein [Arabidopsis lyrata subsp. lyrata]|uniref:RabGAP/TBC domain-containing protein n=1 Tax=Arabidopsis lyrata subsp. lyrata TaxID=81972 RepID=D7LWE7_ARALL|nr:RabGAP/TBC domain-containing protein [Arabidopsis lyrata subsp. lyrata]